MSSLSNSDSYNGPQTTGGGGNTYVPPVAVDSLTYARIALANTRAGLKDTKILCIGADETWGTGSATINPASQGSYPAILAAALGSRLGGFTSVIGFANPPGSLDVYADSRFSLGNGWACTGTVGFGSTGFTASYFGGVGPLVYSPGTNCDTFDVFYINNSGISASFSVSITGGGSNTITCNDQQTYHKVSYSAGSLSASNTISFQPISGAITIVGVEAYCSNIRTVRIGNAGCPGVKLANYLVGGAMSSSSGNQLLALYEPDLTIITFGQYDAIASTSSSTFYANLLALVTTAQLTGDAIICSGFPLHNNGLQSFMAQYQPEFKNLAEAKNCTFFDMYNRLGEVFSPLFMSGDGLTAIDAGIGDFAAGILNVLSSVV